jgi:nucleoside-diphosphate-sugar epimerase
MLRVGGVEPDDALSFAVANLASDEGWPQTLAGCDYVLHVASPFPLKVPRNEDELIVPAREGALRVLRAARDAGVRRVVLTSSFAAIGYGTTPGKEPYTEENWTNPDGPGVTAYAKSKTLAERAAWDFIAREGGSLQLSVVNPVAVFGPVFSRDFSTSIVIVQRLLNGGVPACPRIKFGAVDVRDVALHVIAMTHPAAARERFIAVAGSFISILQIAQILRQRMGAAASRVPTREMPDWILRLIGLFDPTIRQIVPELGKQKDATSAKAQRMLGWQPLSAEDSIMATAESLQELGLVKR